MVLRQWERDPEDCAEGGGRDLLQQVSAAQQLLTIHNNGSFQQSYVIDLPASLLTASPASKPHIYTPDPGFRISRDVQMSLTIDRSFGKVEPLNVSYLYTRGIHQYYANNVDAPYFNPLTYIDDRHSVLFSKRHRSRVERDRIISVYRFSAGRKSSIWWPPELTRLIERRDEQPKPL
jgi:hypothetical protein